MADLQRCVIQFIHPGGEHGPDIVSSKRWNQGLHKRKFLQTSGDYMTERNGPRLSDVLTFWGEWEPESDVTTIEDPIPNGPKFIHRPYYVRPSSYSDKHENTDPFVYGNQFLYTLCRQSRKVHDIQRPTFLRDLAPGSLILFGSLKGGEFVLDTTFVVADGTLHNAENWETNLEGLITDAYADVTMRPTYQAKWMHELRLYRAATPDHRINGMFSFVPCLPTGLSFSGFARPTVKFEGVITPALMMGTKVTRGLSLECVEVIWNSIATQILDQGLRMGTRFDIPERRNS